MFRRSGRIRESRGNIRNRTAADKCPHRICHLKETVRVRFDQADRPRKDRTADGREERRSEIRRSIFELLRREAEIISSDSVSLEEAMESYKKGKEYFEICSRKLQEAKQLIQIYDKENDTIKEM